MQERTNLDAVNEHAVTTILSFLLLLPLVFFYEGGSSLTGSFSSLLHSSSSSLNLFLCGMCFYLYNELQNVVLGSLGAVPTAVGNTLKRVVIFAALYFFTPGETFPWPKVLGCAIAIAGCFAFAVFDSLKV
jgi:solute carrier family 35, member E1